MTQGEVTVVRVPQCRTIGRHTREVRSFNLKDAILKLSSWRWPMRIPLIATILVIVGVGCIPLLSPAMAVEDRTKLQEAISRAAAQVTAFYGSFDHTPTLLACASEECDHRLGGKGARANTYGTTFIRVSPNGLNQTILAHEFSHVELHTRIRLMRFLVGAIPAWFDEGLAVIVSDDARYLKPGTTSAMRCLVEPEDGLPSSPSQWRPLAAKTPGVYAQAACRVMRWMEANGGTARLLTMITQIADGTRQFP